MAGKVSDEQMFELEKRMKKYEDIIGAMSEEERSNPDMLCKQGGKKELVLEANQRKEALAKKTGYNIKEVTTNDGYYVRCRIKNVSIS
jgi:signal recognition particle GTPase